MQDLKSLISKLKTKNDYKLNMIIGLDGFVDEINHIVDKRLDFSNFTRICTMKELGERIIRASGLSTNIELVPVHVKLGGNGPILSCALLEYDVDIIYIGALGKPHIHSVFQDLTDKADKVFSVCNPGYTKALELEDGKIMLGTHADLGNLTWNATKEAMGGAKNIAVLINNTNLLGLENWTMLPHMSSIWEGLIDEVFPLIDLKNEKPFAFFDLADPEKRTKNDLSHALSLIGQFEEKFRVILGVNEKEAYEIASTYNIHVNGEYSPTEKLKRTASEICNKLNIHCFVVHTARSACCIINKKYFEATGPYCNKPKLLTGAGDNFNAGFCLGQALNLNPTESLLLGLSTGGYYVRHAKSPSFESVIDFIDRWDIGQLID